MKHIPSPSTVVFALVFLTSSANAQTQRVFTNTASPGSGDFLWSNASNWVDGNIADDNTEIARFQASPILDQDYTVNSVRNFNGTPPSWTLSSTGGAILTLDLNTTTASNAILNQSLTQTDLSRGNLEFTGNVAINNSASTAATNGISRIGFLNSTDTQVTFSAGSGLNIVTSLETASGSLGNAINFNGAITGGSANIGGIRIGANSHNVTFGATADNTGYAGDIVYFANGQVVSETTVAGGLVRAGSKIQVNGSGGSLTLNGAGGMRGNVVIGANNSFTLNANANQTNMGVINLDNGSELTIALGASISELAFANSSSIDWGTGQISISGFQVNTIRFGSDVDGLTQTQLDKIDGGIYSLNSQGYLIPEPSSLILVGVFGLAVTLLLRRRR